jgi:rRNA maturation endonuclease Nob1
MVGFLIVLLYIVGLFVSCFILYMIIKAAVRDGIIESRHDSNSEIEPDTIAKITCPACGKKHEMDYPRCPHCGHINFEL